MSDHLIADAQRRVLAGDLKGAAPIFERLAQMRREPAERTQALLSAARLRMMLQTPQKAGALLAQAAQIAPKSQRVALRRAQAEYADLTGDLQTRRQAWRALLAVVDGAPAISAARQLAAISKAADDGAAMLSWLQMAIELAATPDLRDARVDALLERASVHLNMQALDAMQADLDVVGDLLTEEPCAFRARWLGLCALASHGRGDAQAARVQTLEARAVAVACQDVPSYLSATMLLFALQEEAGEQVGAYDTLIRARESLRDLLGETGAGLVQPALTAFEGRLGDELEAVHTAWVVTRSA